MSKITIDLTRVVELTMSQVRESVDSLLLQRWLDGNSGAAHPVTVDLAAVSVEKETEARVPASTFLKVRINDVITFGDDSELRIQALTLRGRAEGLAFEAYYGLLPATSNI
jgi:hypothetical protein